MRNDLLLRADSRRLPLADACVQCVVTSPPYWGLRDYGVSGQLGLESTPDEYVANMVQVFREVRRVLRDDGTSWLNLGDSYAGGGRNSGNSLETTSAKQLTQIHSMSCGKGAVPDGLKPKDLVGIPWRVAFALQADGWYLRSDIIWSKPNPMPESVTDRPTKAHEYIFLISKSERYWYDHEAVKEDSINAGRVVEYDGTQKNCASGDGVNDRRTLISRTVTVASGRNRRSVWHIATQPYSEAHFATYPEALVEPCIKAGCPVGGIVFDPFNGSGTTGAVAVRLGRRYVGCDLNPAYIEMASRRIGKAANPNTFRSDKATDAPLFALTQ